MEKQISASGKRKVKMCSKDKFKEKKMKMTDDTSVSLLNLNDYCLLHVFSYMKIRDVMNSEQTCTRLKNVAHLYYNTTKTFEWTSDIPFACAPKIIVKFGRFTTSLHSIHFNRVRKPREQNKNYNNFIETLLDNCKNVKSLKFTNCDVSCEWAPFFDALHSLESLSLHSTHLRHSNYLRRVHTLKQFELKGRNSFETGKFNYFLASNTRLERLTLDDCEDLTKDLRFDIVGDLKLKSLSLEVYYENIEGIDVLDEVYNGPIDEEYETEVAKCWEQLKELKLTQKDKKSNLNSYLKKITEKMTTLTKLELFKFNVDESTFAVLKGMKLETLILYPKFKDNDISSKCRMLVDALPNLKHLTLIFFDLDRDLDLSSHDMLLLITGLKRLESLNLHNCESDCEYGCDYIVCPFRCKLRKLIQNINEIFKDTDRPPLKFMLPRRVSRTFFHASDKVQKKVI